MTLKLTIKNDNFPGTGTARVRTRDLARGDDGKHTGACIENDPPKELAPGESAEFWIHNHRDLVVEEKQ